MEHGYYFYHTVDLRKPMLLFFLPLVAAIFIGAVAKELLPLHFNYAGCVRDCNGKPAVSAEQSEDETRTWNGKPDPWGTPLFVCWYVLPRFWYTVNNMCGYGRQ
jgi:hypothetical protein